MDLVMIDWLIHTSDPGFWSMRGCIMYACLAFQNLRLNMVTIYMTPEPFGLFVPLYVDVPRSFLA